MGNCKGHLIALDLLRGIAAFGIVGCHLALTPMTDGGRAVRALCDMNVGLFAALSGFLMWKQGVAVATIATWKDYALRRCHRLLPVYVAWTVLFLLFGLLFDLTVRHGINPKLLKSSFWVSAVFLGGSSTHLWFLICLFYAQIIFNPLFRKMVGLGWLIVGFGLICLAAYNMDNWMCGYFLRLAAFLMTGYGLRDVFGDWHGRYERRQVVAVGIIGVLVSVVGHYALSGIVPVFIRDWLVAVSVLVVFTNLRLPSRWNPLCAYMGKTSLAVFLVHPLVAAMLGLVFRKIFVTPFGALAVAADWVCVWALSFIIAFVLNRLPFTRWCVQ